MAIEYSGQINEGLAFPGVGVKEFQLDFNNDGIFELLMSDAGSIDAAPLGDSRIQGVQSTPPDLGGSASRIADGQIIGDEPIEGAAWLDSSGLDNLAASLITCRATGNDITVCLGQFPATGIGYLGVEFQVEESIHYGWVRVDAPFAANAITIVDLAYETSPNTPIVAGAIPEPGSIALLAGIFCLLACWARRRSSRR